MPAVADWQIDKRVRAMPVIFRPTMRSIAAFVGAIPPAGGGIAPGAGALSAHELKARADKLAARGYGHGRSLVAIRGLGQMAPSSAGKCPPLSASRKAAVAEDDLYVPLHALEDGAASAQLRTEDRHHADARARNW